MRINARAKCVVERERLKSRLYQTRRQKMTETIRPKPISKVVSELWILAIVFPARLTKGVILENVAKGAIILAQSSMSFIGPDTQIKTMKPVYATTVERYGNIFAQMDDYQRSGKIIGSYRAVDLHAGDVALLIASHDKTVLRDIRALEKTEKYL